MHDLKRDCSFKPTINEYSEKIVADGQLGNGFFERQRVTASRREENRIRAVASAPSNMHCTFKPEIGNADAVLEYMRPERMKETAEQRHERMSVLDRQKIEQKRRRRKNELFEEKCTFKPTINPVSKALGRSSSVEEMTEGSQMAKVRRRRALVEANQKFVEECPFKPKIRKSKLHSDENAFRMGYGRICENADVVEKRMRQRQAELEEKLERERHAKVVEKLKDCTFHPEINSQRPKTNKGPVVVRGLGRFLELRDLAKRREEEKSQREREVFCEPPEVIHRTHTVPQPFRLATDANARRHRARQLEHAEELREREMLECTFRPKTYDGEKRKEIRELLLNESFHILYDDENNPNGDLLHQ